MEVYNCKIKTLSPIHIGSGKDYGPSEYINGKAKTKQENIINTIDRIDFTKYYKELPTEKQEKFLSHLSDGKFRLKDYDSKINKKFRRYRCINKSKSETTDITEHIKTSDELYIPGSSIKGAIKTAIFYDRLEDRDIEKITDKLIIQRRNGSLAVDNRRNYSNFIDKYFSAQYGNSAQKNIMRFIQISDSSTIKIPTIHEVMSVMAKSSGGMPRGSQFYARRGNVVKSYLETIDKGKNLKSELTINYDKKIIDKVGLTDKADILNINYLKKIIYNFSKRLIEYELEFSNEYDISYLTKYYTTLSKYNSEEKPLLKIGAGSGLMATSIAMKVKDYDPFIFDEIRKTFRRAYEFEFPKSRKVTKTGLPLSWTQMNFTKK